MQNKINELFEKKTQEIRFKTVRKFKIFLFKIFKFEVLLIRTTTKMS